MPFEGIIFDEKQASAGKYKSVGQFTGDLVSLAKKDSEQYDSCQIEAKFANVTIQSMRHGLEAPELKDNSYTIYWPYGKKGEDPGKSSFWIKGVCQSAKDIKLAWPPVELPLVGVTLAYKEVKLFTATDPKTKAKTENFKEGFVFVPSDGSNVEPPEAYVKTLVLGLNPSAALRVLMLDPKTTDLLCRDEMNDGSFAEKYGLQLNGDTGVFEAKP